MTLNVPARFCFALIGAFAWLCLSIYLSHVWFHQLEIKIDFIPSLIILSLIAFIPGFMNMFVFLAYILDSRIPLKEIKEYPGISVIIAAYNEERNIIQTLQSVFAQDYSGAIQIIVVDDGSTDQTATLITEHFSKRVTLVNEVHVGKANALNSGLTHALYDLIITLDADTFLMPDALSKITRYLLSSSENTAAVAGSIYVKNFNENYITRVQEWDYINSMSAVKRVQSLFKGTLVAQGAFSIYRKHILQEIGGWPFTVGEDIVMTWKLLSRGYRVDYADDAIALTNIPTSYKQFFRQRSRWARGLMEAFRHNPKILFRSRLTTFFIYWNLFFPLIDFNFLFVLTPGIIAGILGFYYIAGPATLAVIPIAIAQNLIYAKLQHNRLRSTISFQGKKWSFVNYLLFYNFFLVPACVHGYTSEFLKLRKKWGTKP